MLGNAKIGIGALLAAIALVWGGQRVLTLATAPTAAPIAIDSIAAGGRYHATGHRLGPNGTVVVTEFADFQCPFCRRAHARFAEIAKRNPGLFVVNYRHLLLPQHKEAFGAALAAECAGQQGRFTEYHHELFGAQDSIGIIKWTAFAERAGVADLKSFERCLTESALAREAIQRDTLAARELGGDVTPLLLIGRLRVRGILTEKDLERLIVANRASAIE